MLGNDILLSVAHLWRDYTVDHLPLLPLPPFFAILKVGPNYKTQKTYNNFCVHIHTYMQKFLHIRFFFHFPSHLNFRYEKLFLRCHNVMKFCMVKNLATGNTFSFIHYILTSRCQS